MLLVSIIPTIKAIAKNGIIAPNQTCELLPSTYFSRIREAIETTLLHFKEGSLFGFSVCTEIKGLLGIPA